MPKSKASRGGRRGGSSVPKTISVLDPLETIDRRVASRNDMVTEVGRCILRFSASTSPGGTPINAAVLGARCTQLSGIYLRWRIVKLTCVPVASVSSLQVASCVGFADDPVGSSGTNPTSSNDIFALRSSVVTGLGANPVLYYEPPDKTRWYYCQPVGSGDSADIRLQDPCALYAQNVDNATSTSFIVVVRYTLQYSGACEPSGS